MNLGKASFRLLSLLGAAALGSGLTLAFHQQQSSPPPSAGVKAETSPLPLAFKETTERPANDLAERIFEGYHKSVVSDFQKRPSFGPSRLAPHPGFSPYLDTSFSRFSFTFIGNDPDKRKYQVDDPALEGLPLVFRISEAYLSREKLRNAVMLENTDPFQRAPVYEPGALFDKDLKPEVSRPSEAEFAILARFETTPAKMIEFQATADGTFGYGALRASASCLACHDKPEGTLLGLFRYHFENGPTAWAEDLVSK